MNTVRFNELEWSVSRQVGVQIGFREPGGAAPEPRASGLWFRSPTQPARFLQMDIADLPSEDQLRDSPLSSLVEWFNEAVVREGT